MQNDRCHRVTTQLQLLNNIIIIITAFVDYAAITVCK
jgi:hypothetical protein